MKTAVVTGGASGIGAAIVARLRADGYRVAVFDRAVSEAAAADEWAFAADVTDRAQLDAALARVRDQAGPVTIVVNAAGADGFKRFSRIAFAEWQRIIDVNLNGVFHTIQATLPDMVEAGWGRIVNISSSSTHSGTPYMSHYVAAKSAVNGLTKSLALEYGPNGITVNAVPPGFIDTPMLRNADRQGFLGDIEDNIAKTPVRRIGRPEDIAAACAFFVSEEAGYITGQILGVNGGRNT
ncbi:SDR family oxidoreductase [Mycolicibacillus parakoreensis]|uniref:3-oxoacyl-[acyl-carrier-protein] reductase MabA n=1 Tax=Mycolicibacillus parakoreensis TaxID=1069221 RepID=A0ABY3TYK4_9MYCO|nr:SDR family NAD(P)-dependent oxidoreductase [Mycolicibacillus parakoreensis]MCV7317096.1 SDR family oxidoreductase [Mycolicibacillus parakoreensis]ULN51420.1 SDR family oxidoreductase [Mycolicibacillus parakoreensis]